VRCCVTAEELRPLRQQSADSGIVSPTSPRHWPADAASAAGDDAECRVGLLQRYVTITLWLAM